MFCACILRVLCSLLLPVTILAASMCFLAGPPNGLPHGIQHAGFPTPSVLSIYYPPEVRRRDYWGLGVYLL